jgi:anti-sigma B factor antagonist
MDVMVSSGVASAGSDHCDSGPIVSRDGARTVVWLEGEYDIATAVVLGATLANASSRDDADLVVDLSGVTFIDAATIGVLIRGGNGLRRESRSLTLRSPSRWARRLLDIWGLTALVEPDTTPAGPPPRPPAMASLA